MSMKAGAFKPPSRREVEPGGRVLPVTRASTLSSSTLSQQSLRGGDDGRNLRDAGSGRLTAAFQSKPSQSKPAVDLDSNAAMSRARALGLKRAPRGPSDGHDSVDVKGSSVTTASDVQARRSSLPTGLSSQQPPDQSQGEAAPDMDHNAPSPTLPANADVRRRAMEPQLARVAAGAEAGTDSQQRPNASLFDTIWGKASQILGVNAAAELSGSKDNTEGNPANSTDDIVRRGSLAKYVALGVPESSVIPFVEAELARSASTMQRSMSAPVAATTPSAALVAATLLQKSNSESRRIPILASASALSLPGPRRPLPPGIDPITWHRPPPIHPPNHPHDVIRLQRRAKNSREPDDGSTAPAFTWLEPRDMSPLDQYLFHRAAGRAPTRKPKGDSRETVTRLSSQPVWQPAPLINNLATQCTSNHVPASFRTMQPQPYGQYVALPVANERTAPILHHPALVPPAFPSSMSCEVTSTPSPSVLPCTQYQPGIHQQRLPMPPPVSAAVVPFISEAPSPSLSQQHMALSPPGAPFMLPPKPPSTPRPASLAPNAPSRNETPASGTTTSVQTTSFTETTLSDVKSGVNADNITAGPILAICGEEVASKAESVQIAAAAVPLPASPDSLDRDELEPAPIMDITETPTRARVETSLPVKALEQALPAEPAITADMAQDTPIAEHAKISLANQVEGGTSDDQMQTRPETPSTTPLLSQTYEPHSHSNASVEPPEVLMVTPTTQIAAGGLAWALPTLSLDLDLDFGADDESTLMPTLMDTIGQIDMEDAKWLDGEKDDNDKLPLPVFRLSDGEPDEEGDEEHFDATTTLSPTNPPAPDHDPLEDVFAETADFVNDFSLLQASSLGPNKKPTSTPHNALNSSIGLSDRSSENTPIHSAAGGAQTTSTHAILPPSPPSSTTAVISQPPVSQAPIRTLTSRTARAPRPANYRSAQNMSTLVRPPRDLSPVPSDTTPSPTTADFEPIQTESVLARSRAVDASRPNVVFGGSVVVEKETGRFGASSQTKARAPAESEGSSPIQGEAHPVQPSMPASTLAATSSDDALHKRKSSPEVQGASEPRSDGQFQPAGHQVETSSLLDIDSIFANW